MQTQQINLLTGEEILDRVLNNTTKDYSKLVRKSYHGKLPLVSLCYSSLCNLGKPEDPGWDDVTLSCRGIILNTETKEIVSKPWNKFFNYDPNVSKVDITEDSYILEKMDGSLGVSYREPGTNKIRIATKNSFNNEMTSVANKWIENLLDKLGMDPFDPKLTYLFEIIYPENYSNIIKYGSKRECFLLGIVDTQTGIEQPFEEVKKFADENLINYPKSYSFDNFATMLKHCKELPWNDEGYVVTIPKFKCKFKLKGDKFVEIHRIVYGLNQHRIWRAILDGVDLPKTLEEIPEELKREKLAIYNQILNEKNLIIENAKIMFEETFHEGITRKDFALKVMTSCPRDLQGLQFVLLDGKTDQLDKSALKIIENNYKVKGYEEDVWKIIIC